MLGSVIPLILIFIVVLGVIAVVVWGINWIFNELLYSLPIKVEVFSIDPTSIPVGGKAVLTIKIQNRQKVQQNVTIHLVTDENVNIFDEEGHLLPRVGLNFTCLAVLGPQQADRTLRFNVTGAVTGTEATYNIDGHFTTDVMTVPITESVKITVQHG